MSKLSILGFSFAGALIAVILLTLTVSAMTIPTVVPTTDGDLDPTFGSGGNVTTAFPVAVQSRAFASAIQPDGKIVVAGAAGDYDDSNYNDFALTRYNSDGTLDSSFGNGGRVQTDFAYNEDHIYGIAIQADGKIVAAGFARMNCCSGWEDFALIRYNPDGSLDSSFGTGGKVHTDIGGAGDKLYDVKIQPDGKIVGAGTANNIFALARYNTDGSPDTTFGSGGHVLTGFSGSLAEAYGVALQSDGKIVAAGANFLSGASGADFALARYNANGSLDTSFGTGGKVTTDIRPSDLAKSLTIQPTDNKIVVAGTTNDPFAPADDAVVARYNTNGTLDTSFNSTGIVITDLGGDFDSYSSVIIQYDNKIAAAGYSDTTVTGQFALARYNTNGTLDSGFGTGGIVLTDFRDGSDMATRLLQQTDGKLVASGITNDVNMWPHVAQSMARYNTNGTLDSSFGTGGKVTTFHLRSNASVSKVEIQSDGKIVAAGSASYNFALARYNTNGTLDSSFGTGGTVTTTTSLSPNLVANGLTLQNDGKIVTIGFGIGDTGRNIALARYNTNGTLDSSFGTGGVVLTSVGGGTVDAFAVKQRPDGKLLALGYNGFSSAVLILYNTNGTLDTSFGTNGIVLDDFGINGKGNDLALQSDGKIVVGGTGEHQGGGSNADLLVARYNSDGTHDNAFGTGGHARVDFGANYEEGLALAVQPDGNIVIGGYSIQTGPGYEWALARFNPNGTLDSSFGNAGRTLTDFSTEYDELFSLKVLSDGHIVAGGQYGRVGRYNSDGLLDTSFGNGGSITNPNVYIAYGLGIQTDGKIVAGGTKYDGSEQYFDVARFINSLSVLTPTPRPTATATPCVTGLQLIPWQGEMGFNHLYAVKAWSSNDVWGAGVMSDSLIIHWDGSNWANVPSSGEPGHANSLLSIDGSAPNDMWAVGNYYSGSTGYSDFLAFHWNGSQWTRVTLPTVPGTYYMSLNGVAALAANDVWVVGYAGNVNMRSTLIEHWNGTSWSIVPSPNGTGGTYNILNAVAGHASNDTWAVGFYQTGSSWNTLIEHWDGSQWSVIPSPNIASAGNTLTSVAVESANSVWAVGQAQEIGPPEPPAQSLTMHWDGSTWSIVASPNPSPRIYLTGVSAADNSVWASGYYQDTIYRTFVMRWSGGAWQQLTSLNPSSTFNAFYGISAVSNREVWTAGEQGVQFSGQQTLVEQYHECGTPSPAPTGQTATATRTTTATATRTSTSTTPISTATRTATAVGTTTSVSTVTSTSSPTRTATSQSSGTPTTVATASVTACPIEFTDVQPGSTFYSFVRCLACRGIINGYSDGTFKPNNLVTRGQLSKIVANAAGFIDPQSAQIFQDVPPGSTFFDFINRLASRGYIGGYACGGAGEPCVPPDNLPYFRPNNNATRGQITKIVSNTAQLNQTPTGQQFQDVPIASTYYTYTYRLVTLNIMSGYPCGNPEPCVPPNNLPYFRPNNNATRGQTSKIVSNTFYPNCQTPAKRQQAAVR